MREIQIQTNYLSRNFSLCHSVTGGLQALSKVFLIKYLYKIEFQNHLINVKPIILTRLIE